MKKLVRNLFVLGSLIAISNFINQRILKNTVNYFKNKELDLNFYKWIHGKINYTVCGSGEPLLLIHGIYPGASSYEWENSKKYLSEKFRVYTIDLLGFGFSDKPNLSYSPYLYTSLINSFIRDVIKKQTNVIANGLTADYTVMAYNFAPNNFNKIMLISPSGVGTGVLQPSTLNIFFEMVINLPIIGTAIYNMMTSRLAMELFLKYKCFSSYHNVSYDFIMKYYYMAHYGGANSKCSVSSFISGLLNIDINNHITNISKPMIIVWGDKSNVDSVKSYYYIEKGLKDANLVRFSNCKTLLHIENYKKFNKICSEFFN